jgi:hypothetical protein
LQFGVYPREPYVKAGQVRLNCRLSFQKLDQAKKKSEPFGPGFSMLCCEFQVINNMYNTNLPIVKASGRRGSAGNGRMGLKCKEMVNAALRQSVRF